MHTSCIPGTVILALPATPSLEQWPWHSQGKSRYAVRYLDISISRNLEMANIGEDGKRLWRSSQSDKTLNPVMGIYHRKVKTKTSFEEPTGTKWSAFFEAGHWKAVPEELRSQDPPNKSKTGGAVTPDRPPLAEQFRSLMRLTPSSVVIVFAEYHREDEPEKEVFGLLVASFTTVSLNPEPYVSFNIKRPSKTYNQILQTKCFTILAPENAMLAAAFAIPGNKSSILRQVLDKTSGEPRPLFGVLWWAKCELLAEKSVDVGDHTIVVGRVVKVGITKAAPRRGHVIVYSAGQYRELGPCVPPLDEISHLPGNIGRSLKGRKAQDIKEASLEPWKVQKKQHGANFDRLINYHFQQSSLLRPHKRLSFPTLNSEQAAGVAMDAVHIDQANDQVAAEHNRLSFPSLEREQAAGVAMDDVHIDQGNDQVAAEHSHLTSGLEVEVSEIPRRPAKLSEGMQDLYDSFSGWMQESKEGVEEPIDGEATQKEAQSATGTRLATSRSDQEGEEALTRKDDPSATGTGPGKSPSGFDDASQVENTGAEGTKNPPTQSQEPDLQLQSIPDDQQAPLHRGSTPK